MNTQTPENEEIELELISPLFSYGAYPNRPEIRPASIRGMLHWWFRAAGGTYADEREIFGGVSVTRHPDQRLHADSASRLIVRTGIAESAQSTYPRLPHKQNHKAAPRIAFSPGTHFTLFLNWRLAPPPENTCGQFKKALQLWLLAGSLGTRSTRGGGAIQRAGTTFDSDEWRNLITNLTTGAPLQIRLLPQVYPTAEEARRTISDTIGGPFQRNDWGDLSKLHWPLGDVSSGRDRQNDRTRSSRKTSPLRLTLRRFTDGIRIIAVWDGRQEVTGNTKQDLLGAIRALQNARKPIGDELAAEWK